MVKRVLGFLRLGVIAVWGWAIVTGHLGVRFWASVAFLALLVVTLAINTFQARRQQQHDFERPRSAYPNGDNGYSRLLRRRDA